MKRLGVLLLPPDGIPVYHKVTPPTFSQTSLKIHRYQFKLLGVKDTLKVTCFAQNNNNLTRLGLNRDHTLDPDCQRTNHQAASYPTIPLLAQ